MANTTSNRADGELPPAMVNYLAERLTKVSKNAGGHRGQKLRAKARRRGTYGKATRRRALARASAVRTSKGAK